MAVRNLALIQKGRKYSNTSKSATLTRKQSYRHFSDERIAYKYLTWAWQVNESDRDGLTRQQFARYYLMTLGRGHDLERVALDPKHPRRLASEAELLALRPELSQIE